MTDSKKTSEKKDEVKDVISDLICIWFDLRSKDPENADKLYKVIGEIRNIFDSRKYLNYDI